MPMRWGSEDRYSYADEEPARAGGIILLALLAVVLAALWYGQVSETAGPGVRDTVSVTAPVSGGGAGLSPSLRRYIDALEEENAELVGTLTCLRQGYPGKAYIRALYDCGLGRWFYTPDEHRYPPKAAR